MRTEKRIKPFLDTLIKSNNLNKDLLVMGVKFDLKSIVKTNRNQIEDFWMEHPDYRFTQVLITLNIYNNIPGGWFYCEEINWFNDFEDLREVFIWHSYGVNGDEDKYVLLKDMELSHIQAILKTQFHITEETEELLKEEIKYRSDK